MSFDRPQFLILLSLFLVAIPVFIIRYRKCRGKAAIFAAAAPSSEKESFLKELRSRMIFSDLLFLLFFGLLIVALSGPRWGSRIVNDYRRGVDIVMAFDLSRSMGVRDCQGGNSRLEQGMEIAREIAASSGDIRIGSAIGKGKGFVAVPLTYDSETVINFLYSLDSQSTTGSGTNLESLVDAALGAFTDSIPSRRGIILFSDGEALSGSLRRAVERARKAGITVSAVGLGSDSGGPVPVRKSPEAPDGFLLGADGRTMTSSRQSDTLKAEAERSGGIYIDGNRDTAAASIAGYINSLQAESRLSGSRREAKQRWQIFVLAAMLCLTLMRLMGLTLRKNKRGRLPINALMLLCLVSLSSCGETRGKLLVMEANFYNSRGHYTEAISAYLKALDHEDAQPYAEYGLASTFFALEEGSAAMGHYEEAEKSLGRKREDHPELRYRIYYNRGIIHFENGEYTEAADFFKRALKVDSSRIEAKRNLELSLLTIARSPQSASSQEKTEDDDESSNNGASALFEYLSQKEQEQWKSREWIEESSSVELDY